MNTRSGVDSWKESNLPRLIQETTGAFNVREFSIGAKRNHILSLLRSLKIINVNPTLRKVTMKQRSSHPIIEARMSVFLALVVLVLLFVSAPPSIGQTSPDIRQLSRNSNQASDEKIQRLALVIGNGAYQDSKLRNPPNDATAVAVALRDLEFEVISGIDKSQREMKRAIRDFGQRLRANGGVGLFYFAGHGVQANGHNYLIPIDADIQTEADLEDQAVDVNYLLSLLDEAQNALNIVILDACRNNPFARNFRSSQNGLAQVKAPTGTLIAYSTAPGSTAADGDAANSPYTEELIKQFRAPGVLIETMFRRLAEQVSSRTRGRQEPWFSANVKGDFFFSAGSIMEEQQAMRPRPSINSTATNAPESSDPQQYYARSVASLNRGSFEEAMIDINKAIELSPAFAQAYAVRGGLYHIKNNLDGAIADSTKAIELNLNNEAPYVVRGSSYNMKRRYDEALVDFNKAIQLNPQSGPAYSGRGVSYSGKGEYAAGISDFTKAIALAPNDMQTYYNRGTAYAQLKDYDHALADFNKTIELNPNLAGAYNNRAIVYEKKGDLVRAAADKKKFLELIGIADTPATQSNLLNKPPSVSVPELVDSQQYYARSFANLNRGNLNEALADIDKAIELSPSLALAYALRAAIYSLKNNHDAAIADSTKAIDLKLENETPYFIRGYSYNNKGQYDLALVDFDKAIKINAQSGPAYSGRGNSFSGKGEYDKAIIDYTRGIALVGNEAQTYYNRGAAYFQQKDYDRALMDFNKAIELNPTLAVAYNYRALVYDKKGDPVRAEADRKKYRELYGIK